MNKVRAHVLPVSSIHVPATNRLTVTVRDADDGAMSITNDAEAVVEDIYRRYFNERSPDTTIVIRYWDTDRTLWELVHDKGKFKDFRPVGAEELR